MPSKFRKAIGAVKDKTSISLAKVSNNNASNLEVLILKATRHDSFPIDERYVVELFNLISSNKIYAASCAHAIGKRIGKTRNWIVVLKSLMLVLRVFQDGDPYFPREVLHTMKRGAKILNLSCFRDDSHSNPWDYTAYVRTFALYLEERLDCFVTGKLQKRFTRKEREPSRVRGNRRANRSVSEMKPAMLIDRISSWQNLLDKAVGTRPTGVAKNNRLVQISLYAIVQESFDLYRDISDGLALLLDSFFHLQYNSCVKAFQTCVKASKKFQDLSHFYDLCKNIGVGRSSEYPSVQKISEELIETLKEFLKDESSFTTNGRSPQHLLPQAINHSPNYGEMFPSFDQSSDQLGALSESEISQCPSLEDLMSVTDVGTSPPMSMDIFLEQFEKPSFSDDPIRSVESVSVIPLGNGGIDLVSLDAWPPDGPNQEQELGDRSSGWDSIAGRDAGGWEDVLVECTRQPMQGLPNEGVVNVNFSADEGLKILPNGIDSETVSNLFDQGEQQYNPFLQEPIEMPEISTTTTIQDELPLDDVFPIAPTFRATPTFSAQNPDAATEEMNGEHDLFGPCFTGTNSMDRSNGSMDKQTMLLQQQLWVQQQDKILAKKVACPGDLRHESGSGNCAAHLFSLKFM